MKSVKLDRLIEDLENDLRDYDFGVDDAFIETNQESEIVSSILDDLYEIKKEIENGS